MKVEALKKIIKEAVKEAVREELDLREHSLNSKTLVKNTPITEDLLKPAASDSPSSNVIMDMVKMTRESMTADDYRAITNGGSTMAPRPDFTMESTMPAGPQPGLDISNLDFVQKAASVLKLAEEKSKNR